jgi:hypothetical protein
MVSGLGVTIVRYVWFQLGARRPARAIVRAWGGRRLSEPRQAGRPVRAAASSTPTELQAKRAELASMMTRAGVEADPWQLDVVAAMLVCTCPLPVHTGRQGQGVHLSPCPLRRTPTGPAEWLPNGSRPVSR